MKKTKIICTMGPNSDDREVMKALILNGMDVARFNFSHGTHEEQKARLDLLKSVREELDIPVAALLDTKGPEIRTGLLEGGGKVMLTEGQEYTLTTREIEGNDKIAHINYDGLNEDVEPGNRILIDDGLIELEVQKVDGTDIVCTVINGGELGQRKGVNVPNVKIKLPALTEKDKEDIRFGIEQGFDFIAASFVRTPEAVEEIKAILAKAGSSMQVISKIENAEGLENLDEIIAASDGIMVARGDLGVEIPPERVPHIQKKIIQKCNLACKTVITATQMLDSMIRNPRPTRAEVTDVANAIYDGTDAVMLSGETAMGKYPVEALKMMHKIAVEAESHLDYDAVLNEKRSYRKRGISSAVSYAAVATAYHMNAKAILIPTMSGYTARLVSKFRPHTRVISTSPYAGVLRKMQLMWGINPLKTGFESVSDDVMYNAVEVVKNAELVESGDMVVITAGIGTVDTEPGARIETNVMRVINV